MIAAQLAERRRLAAQAAQAAADGGSADDADASDSVSSARSLASRREAELAARKALRSKVELAAGREAERLMRREHSQPPPCEDAAEDARCILARREAQEGDQLRLAKAALAQGSCLRSQSSSSSTCAICGGAVSLRQAKRLPCGHSFHFVCIDDFHRRKMREERAMDLPCFQCGAPSHKSIAAVVEERKRQKEAEAAAAAMVKATEAKPPALPHGSGSAAAAAASAAARRRGGGALAALARASQASAT